MLLTVLSAGFLYKVDPLELKNSPIMYFVIRNSVVLSKILKIVVPFLLLFVYVDYYQNNQFYRVKNWIFKKNFSNGTTIFNILDNTTELWMTKYIIGEFFSSSRATLYKNPSDQTVLIGSRIDWMKHQTAAFCHYTHSWLFNNL